MDASASAPEFATALVAEASVECGTAFVNVLEEQIERSRSHWSELTESSEGLSVEEAAAIKLENEEVFKAWQSHPEWGFFFKALGFFEEFKVGEKFAEGAQAELFHVHVRSWNPKENARDLELGTKYVVKVFKEGTSLQVLQRQWPHGLFQFRASLKERIKLGKSAGLKFQCQVMCATLLEDGRFAFIMQKEDEDLRSLIDRKMMESGHGGGGPFSRVVGEELMCDVALGMDELHRYNIVHRDLKASNVLVFTNRYSHCVVADYECSIGVVGTGYWRAPEILHACRERNVRERPELFSKAADIYSLGMTFYEILTGKQPFQDEEVTMDVVIKGRRPDVPEFVDEWARQLLLQCWQSDCDARPSDEDILLTLEANSCSKRIKRITARRLELLEEEQTSATEASPRLTWISNALPRTEANVEGSSECVQIASSQELMAVSKSLYERPQRMSSQLMPGSVSGFRFLESPPFQLSTKAASAPHGTPQAAQHLPGA